VLDPHTTWSNPHTLTITPSPTTTHDLPVIDPLARLVQIPAEGTLQEIADAHDQRVAMAVEHRDRIEAAKDAAVRATEADVAAAQARQEAELARLRAVMAAAQAELAAAVDAQQARLTAAVADREQSLAEHDALIATLQEEATAAAQACATFRERVGATGLEDLDVRQVFELLHQLNTPVPRPLLEKQEVSGIVLLGITEGEMATVLKINTLGARRRLALALQRIAGRGGFEARGKLDWDFEQVRAWLAEEGLAPLQRGFREQAIDGEVLLTLTREDLELLDVSTLGGRAVLMSKIEKARKQHDAGQVVGGAAAAAAAFSDDTSVEHQRLVLEHVLRQNTSLAARLAASRERAAAAAGDGGAAAAEPPADYLCPITNELMDDPVVAADGHSYEREAIETWFRGHNTSPMTNQVIPLALLPNVTLRKVIVAWRA
jgi:hypothetical protein